MCTSMLQQLQSNPLVLCVPFFHSLLLPIRFPLLTWNPPCCDRIRPPHSQVALKLIFPFPSPCSYTPHPKIPTPRSSPDPNIHSLGRHREPGSQDRAQERCVKIRLTLFIKSIIVIPTKTRRHDRNSPVIVLECSNFPYPYGNAAGLWNALLCCTQLVFGIISFFNYRLSFFNKSREVVNLYSAQIRRETPLSET